MAFRKINKIAMTVIPVLPLLLTGCAMMPAEGYSESSVRVFGSHSACDNDFTAQEDEDGEPGIPEIPDRIENDPIIDEWPESIRCVAEGLNGEPLRFEMEIEETRTLDISCITEKGKLRIQIQDSDGNILFDEEKIKREDFEVLIDTPGLYTVFVWAEQFDGMFEIS